MDTKLLLDNILERIDLHDIELRELKSFFKYRELKKKEKLLRIGEYCNQLIFVNDGALRSYSIDEKGNERVVQLALADHWIADLFSAFDGSPASLEIEALRASEVLLISLSDLDRLYLQIPALERYFRLLFQKAYVAALRRLNSTHSESAELRYQRLLNESPEILQQVPLIHIASYLGITAESLSRIRKNIH